MGEKIILVDKNDKEVGIRDKLETHRKGKLHRSFSIFIFNHRGELLLQKRALNKYHSSGLWTNTCCSHCRSGETLAKAAHRRLKEEMGISCPVKEIFSFIYKVKLDRLWEYEYDHVFIGTFSGKPKPNPKEVRGWQWINLTELKKQIKKTPEQFTYWFKIAISKVIYHLKKSN